MPRSGVPYTPFTDGPVTASSKPTATSSRKKPGLFSTKKPKALDRPSGSSHTPVFTSPLPITTPSKAAQFFGLESKPKVADSPRHNQLQDDGITDDDAPVRPTLTKQHSLPLLTRLKPGADRQTKFREEGVEPDQAKPTKNVKASANKGLRMLIPDFAGPRRPVVQQTTAVTTRFDLDDDDDDDADVGYSSDSGLHEPRFRIPAAPRPVAAAPKRRMRKKSPKPFERMSPITEASIEELRPIYCEGEDVTELGVICEYECDEPTYSAPVLSRSHTQFIVPLHNGFELDEDDLSPTEEFYDEEATDEEDLTTCPGTKVDVKRVHWQKPTTVHIRSPLQSIEDDYLDATEEDMRLQARRITLARVEAEKQAMDAEIALLKREHERLKLILESSESGGCAAVEPDSTPDEVSGEDEEDVVSLCSGPDFEEESILHEAKAMTFIRITPGMVKFVDILPRKKKPVSSIGSSATPIPNKLTFVERKNNGIVAPANGENVPPASVSFFSPIPCPHTANQLEPVITHYHHEDPDRTVKPKKSKLTRDESCLLVQNWISDYNSTEQRPISTRVDPDVLADQETPPAPFPKSDEALPTPPIKPRSDSFTLPKQLQKHQCINNGHIFHPIDLKQIPDAAAVNSLEVRPYLQTYTGIKQHVHIPVLCEKCGEDCDENVWECEIAVCRMVVCQSCAEDMEAEWQERAVSGWKYK